MKKIMPSSQVFAHLTYLHLALSTFIITMLFAPALLGQTEKSANSASSADQEKERVYTNKEDNALCLNCHASRHVRFTPEGSDKEYIQRMYSDCIIDTTLYYTSNHWNFKCTDCHSGDYEIFPHRADLRFEELPGCLDCHGDDPDYAEFQFEKIQEEYEGSVHFSKHSAEFSCWSCHDSHYYKLNAGNRKQNIKMTIAYDNAICLSCHNDSDKYGLVADRLNPDVTSTHNWLPNQANHFKSVRCIECHTAVNDSLLVAHKILPKEQAVKKCVECHSSDSRLLASLYKYRLEQGGGILQDEVVGDAVLIGARRSTSVNLLSNFLIIATALVIFGHILLRIISRKKVKS